MRRKALGLLLILAAASTGAAFGAGEGRMLGTVEDEDGKPIQAVTVTVTSPDLGDFNEVRKTKKNGTFSIVFAKAYLRYVYRLEKEGYRTLEEEVKSDISGTTRYKFTLVEGSSAAATSVGSATAQPTASNAAIFKYNEGVDAFKAGDRAGARAKFEEAIAMEATFPQAHLALAELLLDMKEYAGAIAEADVTLAQQAGNVTALRVKYDAYRRMGNEEKAEEVQVALQAAGQATEEAKKIYNKGVELHKANDYDGAVAQFRESVAMDPTLEPARRALATVLMQAERWEEAAAASEALLELEPLHEQALRIRYDSYRALEQEEKMAEALVDLGAIDPEFAVQNLYNLGIQHYNNGAIPEAKDRLQKAVEVDPSFPKPLFYLGLCLINDGENEKAKEMLNRFIEVAPDDPEAANAKEMLSFLN